MLTLNKIRNGPRARETVRRPLVVEREKVCPFLLRIFWHENDVLPMEQYTTRDAEKHDDELRIYTW
jgi:hypothetical protein